MKRISLIDYLKAIFIVLVIINHTELVSVTNPAYLLLIVQAVPAFMILSGYTFALSVQGKSMARMYDVSQMVRRFFRYTIPAIIAYTIYLIGWWFRGDYRLTAEDIIERFVMGLYGPGGYYYGMMIQLLLLAPLMYLLIKRFLWKGVLAIGGINLLYEIFVGIIGLDEGVYRVIILRYSLLVALGMYLYLKPECKKNKLWGGLSVIIGLIYLLAPSWGYQNKLFRFWSSTSMMTAFYIYPLLAGMIEKQEVFAIRNRLGDLLSRVGEASYHIMYVQLIYFVGVKEVLYGIINLSRFGPIFEMLFAILISVIGGYIFYVADQKAFGWLYRNKKG